MKVRVLTAVVVLITFLSVVLGLLFLPFLAGGGACFGGACFGGACFGGACFGGACFGGACFGGACFGGACFGGACLGGACLGGACFGGMETLEILSGLFGWLLGGGVARAGGAAPPAATVTVTVAVVTEVETSCTVTVFAGCARFAKLLNAAMSRSCKFNEYRRQERSERAKFVPQFRQQEWIPTR